MRKIKLNSAGSALVMKFRILAGTLALMGFIVFTNSSIEYIRNVGMNLNTNNVIAFVLGVCIQICLLLMAYNYIVNTIKFWARSSQFTISLFKHNDEISGNVILTDNDGIVAVDNVQAFNDWNKVYPLNSFREYEILYSEKCRDMT